MADRTYQVYADAASGTDQGGNVPKKLKDMGDGTFAEVVATGGGGTAAGSAVSEPPTTIGFRAATTNPTAVADGQVVNAMGTKHGKMVTVDGGPRELRGSQKTTITASTVETTIVTAGASGVFNDLYGLILANSGGTTTLVDIRDDTGGAVITSIEVPTLETRGFMLSAGSAFAQTASAKNWTAKCAGSTSSMEVTALFVKNT